MGWRVPDVAAHVAMAPQIRAVVAARRRYPARGSFHRLNHEVAVRCAAHRLLRVARNCPAGAIILRDVEGDEVDLFG
jgi:hypothetical protein